MGVGGKDGIIQTGLSLHTLSERAAKKTRRHTHRHILYLIPTPPSVRHVWHERGSSTINPSSLMIAAKPKTYQTSNQTKPEPNPNPNPNPNPTKPNQTNQSKPEKREVQQNNPSPLPPCQHPPLVPLLHCPAAPASGARSAGASRLGRPPFPQPEAHCGPGSEDS